MAFVYIQKSWGRVLGSPISYILDGLRSNLYQHSFTAIFVILTTIVLITGIKSLKKTYLLYAGALLIIPLFTGITSMPRYILVIFPVQICMAMIVVKFPKVGGLLLVTMALTQGMMLVFWTSGFDLLM